MNEARSETSARMAGVTWGVDGSDLETCSGM